MSELPPLADLHRHLDGSLRESTLRELGQEQGRWIPPLPRLTFYAGMGLEEALSKFAITLDVLQKPEAVKRVAGEICEDAAAEGVTTLEIRFAPQLHRGAEPEEIVDAALEGIAGRAGLILCTLYGEAPAVCERLVEIAKDRPRVVGIDLAGGPEPTQRFIMEDYAKAFTRARELGIGRTVHAGEGRDPEEIHIAIQVLHAQRIGHGTTILEDPTVVRLAIEAGVTLEACPTSNVHTGILERPELHPLGEWLQRGLQACVCTDNVLFSQTTAPQEHEAVARSPAMNRAKLEQAIACGHAAAFQR